MLGESKVEPVINLSGSHLTFSTTEPVQLEVGETVQLPVAGFGGQSSGPLPELENFEVELKKDAQGLGITIAGYVCERGNLSMQLIEKNLVDIRRKK